MNKKLISIFLMVVFALVLQGASYTGVQTGYQTTKEDGADFGYYISSRVNEATAGVPLVVVFGQKAMDAMKWKTLAEEENLIVVAIQPKRGGRWIIQADCPRAEAKIKDMLQRYPIDAKRVWAFGYGRNGTFALVMGINYPGLITAVAGIDATIINAFISDGDTGSGKFVGVFHFNNDPKTQLPILVVNFSAGNQVSDGYQKQAKAIYEKYGYPVTYKTLGGSTRLPRIPDLDQVYSWFKSLK